MNSFLVFLIMLGPFYLNDSFAWQNEPKVISNGSFCSIGLCQYKFNLNHTTTTSFQNQFENMINKISKLEIKMTSDLHSESIGSFNTGVGYLKWINKRIREIGYNRDPNPTEYASVDRFWMPPDYMVFSSAADNMNFMMLFAVLVHESMHGGYRSTGYPHVLCKKNDLGHYITTNSKDPEAIMACDDDHSSAFGVTYTVMCNISKYCQNCSIEEKEMAQEAAKLSLQMITSKTSIEILSKDCQLN